MNEKILLVEDDLLLQKMYQNLFTLEKYDFASAGNGYEGLEKVKLFKPDIVLMDIMMPGINGLEALKKLKSDKESKDIPVIMLTNLGEDAIMKEGFNLGAVGYIIKSSMTPRQVLEEVKAVIAKKSPSSP